MSSITSKVFEHIILLRLEEYLWTTDNQFGFKSGHSTDLSMYALSELIEYFKSRSTSVYVAFLDAGKAFDKISHWTLFRKLIDRNVPMYLTKVLCYWYQHQLMSVRWGYSISNVFNVTNGVRQGGILSPKTVQYRHRWAEYLKMIFFFHSYWLLLLYLYSHIVIQLCSIKMVHVLVTMLITVKHYIQHKYLICAQIQYESINIITS